MFLSSLLFSILLTRGGSYSYIHRRTHTHTHTYIYSIYKHIALQHRMTLTLLSPRVVLLLLLLLMTLSFSLVRSSTSGQNPQDEGKVVILSRNKSSSRDLGADAAGENSKTDLMNDASDFILSRDDIHHVNQLRQSISPTGVLLSLFFSLSMSLPHLVSPLLDLFLGSLHHLRRSV